MAHYAVRKFIYGQVTEEEHAMVKIRARAEGVSVSEWVRRAVNRYLFDSDENAKLIQELGEGRVRASEQDGTP